MDSVFGAIGMLAAVAGILAITYIVTRWVGGHGGGRGVRAGAAGELSVVATLTLGRNERLCLVKVHDRCLLLGVTGQSVTVLKELEGEEAELWLSATKEQAPFMKTFKETLSENLRRKK